MKAQKVWRWLWLLGTLFYLHPLLTTQAQDSIYYVSPTGDDDNSGTLDKISESRMPPNLITVAKFTPAISYSDFALGRGLGAGAVST